MFSLYFHIFFLLCPPPPTPADVQNFFPLSFIIFFTSLVKFGCNISKNALENLIPFGVGLTQKQLLQSRFKLGVMKIKTPKT